MASHDLVFNFFLRYRVDQFQRRCASLKRQQSNRSCSPNLGLERKELVCLTLQCSYQVTWTGSHDPISDFIFERIPHQGIGETTNSQCPDKWNSVEMRNCG